MSIQKIAAVVRGFNNIALIVVVMAAALSILFLFIYGITWASKNLLDPVIALGWIVLAIDIVVLLPLSVFRRLRSFTGNSIALSSLLFGLITFLVSLIVTWEIWGKLAVVIGLLLLGLPLIPFALLASMFDGSWSAFFFVLTLTALTFGSRLLGLWIASTRYPRHREHGEDVY